MSIPLDQHQSKKLANWIVAQVHTPKTGPPRKRGEPLPVITISRQLGCQGTLVAQQLARSLGWEVWEREIVDKIANDVKIHRQMVELLDERASSAWQELSRALFHSSHTIPHQVYVNRLISTILSIAQRGDAVIVGRGANLIVPQALNVRLVASFDFRIANLMQRYQISEREAERRLVRTEQERAEFIRTTFGADIEDVALYDLVLRVDTLGVEGTVRTILCAAQTKYPSSLMKSSSYL